MDRNLVYPGSIPLDTDILQTNRNVQTAIGFLASMVVGNGPVCDGLAFSPTQPASLTINIGPGSYTVASQVDQLAYGSLPTDASPLVKMGINLAATQFTLTAPSVPGQSINYIIEAALQESDANPVVLPYLNAANPSQTFAGPSNSGTAQNTLRIQRVGLQLKAGAAANTGSQLTPAVDIGWTAIYIITVNFGQTQITAPNVTLAPGAPFVNPKLGSLSLRVKLLQDIDLYVSTGGSDVAGNGSQIAPFANAQAAWDLVVNRYDLNGHSVRINIGPGLYTKSIHAYGTPLGFGATNSISFVGNASNPSSVTIQVSNDMAVQTAFGARISVSGITMTATGTVGPANVQACCLVSSAGSGASIAGPVIFGTASGQHIWAGGGSAITNNNTSSYSIAGSAQCHFLATSGSEIIVGGAPSTVSLTGTPNFSTTFANAYSGGVVQCYTTVFSGSATGTRFTASLNGVIITNGSGLNYFPGNAAGQTSLGGQYV